MERGGEPSDELGGDDLLMLLLSLVGELDRPALSVCSVSLEDPATPPSRSFRNRSADALAAAGGEDGTNDIQNAGTHELSVLELNKNENQTHLYLIHNNR